VISTATNAVAATVALGSGPTAVAITPNGARAYVADDGTNYPTSGEVSVIDTATNTVVTTVPVGSTPHGVAITPDGAFAYVSNYHSGDVSVINTATNVVVDAVRGVALTAEGGLAIRRGNPTSLGCR
jgi:YVTN family beta-propeller protein